MKTDFYIRTIEKNPYICVTNSEERTASFLFLTTVIVHFFILLNAFPGIASGNAFLHDKTFNKAEIKEFSGNTDFIENEKQFMDANSLSAPQLILPVNNALNLPITTTMMWETVTGATKYKLQVSSNPEFTTSVIDIDNLINPQYSPVSGILNFETAYYWRVFAGDETGWSPASEIWSYSTGSQPPASIPWTLYNTGVPYSLFGVDFSEINSNTGVAVGQGGTVIKTTDAGVEWMLTYSNINIWMNDVKFDPNTPGVVWAAGMGGVIIKSTDDGSTWTLVREFDTPDHTIRGIGIAPGVPGFVTFIGYAGTYFETFNGGETFVQRFDIPFTMHSIDYSPNYTVDGRAIISGTDGRVWNTTNHGTSWTSRNTNRYDFMNDVVFLTPEVALICGNNGTILRSTNFGKNWAVNMQYITIEHLRSIDAYGNIVTICGDNGKILTSADGGVTFLDQPNGDNRHLYGVSLRESSVGVVVGEIGSAGSGALLYTSMNGMVVGISQNGSEIPGVFTLSQNYPNPFNPVTNIEFTVPELSKVSLIVYDITGKEVKRLIDNEMKAASKYTVQFNAGNLTTGVYFYSLISSNFKKTKKLILLK